MNTSNAPQEKTYDIISSKPKLSLLDKLGFFGAIFLFVFSFIAFIINHFIAF